MTALTLDRPPVIAGRLGDVPLSALTDAELLELYSGDDAPDQLRMDVMVVMAARDDDQRRDRANRDRRRSDPVAAEWRDMAHEQFLQAERDLRGHLVRHDSPVRDAFHLWSGSQAFMERNATADLAEWFQAHPRLTVTAYKAQRAAQLRRQRDDIESEAWTDDRLDPDGSASVRPVAAGEPEGARSGGDSGRDPVPLAAARTEGQDRGARPGAARPGITAGGAVTTQERIDAARDALRARVASRQAAASGEQCQPLAGGQDTAGGMTAPAAYGAPPGAVAVRERGQVSTGQQPDVSGTAVLGYVRAMLAEYAGFPSAPALDAVTLWAAHAHLRDRDGRLAWRATPRLLLMSSQPGSGKSRVLELLGRICPRTFGLDTEPTAAALAHTLDKEHATVLIDEADVLFGRGARREAVRAVINSGYTANGTVLRMRGSRAERARVFGPMAIAGLDVLETATGDALAATLDRCVIIRMTRSAGYVPDLSDRADRAGFLLRGALAAWTQAQLPRLASAAPEMPEGVHGRTAQIWAPLIAIGDAAGGDWPDRARVACEELALHGGVTDDMRHDAMDELAGMFGGAAL